MLSRLFIVFMVLNFRQCYRIGVQWTSAFYSNCGKFQNESNNRCLIQRSEQRYRIAGG